MVYLIILPVLLGRETGPADVKKNIRCPANNWKGIDVKNKSKEDG